MTSSFLLFVRSSFGIAFDIDGVLLLGNTTVGGSPRALSRLYDDNGVDLDVILFLAESCVDE